jgi:Mrp family chromosome partitioning ATPase
LRIILATNYKPLDSYLKERSEDLGITVVKEVYFREALRSVIRQYPADVLLMTSNLPGSDRTNILDYVYQARMANLRVIVLTGEKNPKDELVPALVALGVYDILFGEIKAADIERVIKQPMTMSEIVRAWGLPGKPKPPPGFLDRLKAAIPTESPEPVAVHASEEPALIQEQAPVKKRESEKPAKKTKSTERVKGTPLLLTQEGEPTVMTRPSRPVIAVWSPCSSGKTFVSVHLAKALAQKGLRVGLVDLNLERHDLFHWLLLPEGEDSLSRALTLDVLFSQQPFTGQWKHGLMVFSDDPSVRTREETDAMIDDGNLMRFFNSPKVPADILVCDLPSQLHPYVQRILEHAWIGVLVVDQDYARCGLYKTSIKTLPWEPLVVVNRFAPFDGWDAKEAFGKGPVANVPIMAGETYAAIAHGGLAKEGVSALDGVAASIVERLDKHSHAGAQAGSF